MDNKNFNPLGNFSDCRLNNLKTFFDIINNFTENEIQNISDGYHTFEELYFHRMILFSIICNQNKNKAWKSKLHYDGTMYHDYSIIGIETPSGQFTYHYHFKYDKYFSEIKELEKAPEWDGHTSNDITRLLDILEIKE